MLFELNAEDKKWVDDTLKSLSVREKIGQLLVPMMTKDGAKPLAIPEWAAKYHLGGGHLFGGTLEEVSSLVDAVQAKARVPLFMTGDLDRCGDRVRGGTRFPSQMALGAVDDEELAYEQGKAIAVENTAAGFNWTFSPIVDLCAIRDHLRYIAALSEDPEQVARLAIAQIKGIQDHGMAACAKHFPGDGFDDRDQHLTTTINPLSRKEWFKRSGYTFKKCIDAGVYTIMNSCIACPGLDSGAGDPAFPRPAAISPILIQDILRKELGFEGVIITDALNMGGVTNHVPQPERYARALEAGNDVLLFVTRQEQTLDFLEECVEKGRITTERLDESLTRVLSLKAQLGMHKKALQEKKKEQRKIFVDSPFKKAARTIADKSITLLRDTKGRLPLSLDQGEQIAHVIITNRSNEFLIDTFDTILQETGCTIKRFLNPEPEPMYDEVASGSLKAVITSLFFPVQCGWSTPRCHGPVIPSIMSGYHIAHPNSRPVFISWDSPAHLYELAFMDPFLVTYGSTPYAQEAAAKALLGQIPVTGKVPVSVEGLFKKGDGILRRPKS